VVEPDGITRSPPSSVIDVQFLNIFGLWDIMWQAEQSLGVTSLFTPATRQDIIVIMS
jgi:hypothetical protein